MMSVRTVQSPLLLLLLLRMLLRMIVGLMLLLVLLRLRLLQLRLSHRGAGRRDRPVLLP